MRVRWIPAIVLGGCLLFGTGTYLGTRQEMSRTRQRNQYSDRIQTTIAVVNQDMGADNCGVKENYSAAIIDSLDSGYVLVSPMEAQNGYEEGRYGAVLMFPSTLSKAVISINTWEPEKAELKFMVNPRLPEGKYINVYTRIVELQSRINETLSYTYVASIYDEFHSAQDATRELFQNDRDDMEAAGRVKLTDFTESLKLQDAYRTVFETKEIDFQEFVRQVEGYANGLSDEYLSSYQKARDDYAIIQSNVLDLSGKIKDDSLDWQNKVDEWGIRVDDYGKSIEEFSQKLEVWLTEAEKWQDETVDWNSKVGVYQKDVDDWRVTTNERVATYSDAWKVQSTDIQEKLDQYLLDMNEYKGNVDAYRTAVDEYAVFLGIGVTRNVGQPVSDRKAAEKEKGNGLRATGSEADLMEEEMPEEGKTLGGEPSEGESPGGKPSEEESPGRKPTEVESPGGKPSDGESLGREPTEVESPGGKPSDGESLGREPSEGELPDGKPSEEESPGREPLEVESLKRESSGGKSSEGKSSGGKPSKGESSGGKASEAAVKAEETEKMITRADLQDSILLKTMGNSEKEIAELPSETILPQQIPLHITLKATGSNSLREETEEDDETEDSEDVPEEYEEDQGEIELINDLEDDFSVGTAHILGAASDTELRENIASASNASEVSSQKVEIPPDIPDLPVLTIAEYAGSEKPEFEGGLAPALDNKIPQNGSGTMPELPGELTDALRDLENEVLIYDAGNYLDAEATGSINTWIGSYKSHLGTIEREVNKNLQDQTREQSKANSEYQKFLEDLGKEAQETNQKEQENLTGAINLFYSEKEKTSQENQTLLSDFAEKLPFSRNQSVLNKEVVEFTVAPLKFTETEVRSSVSTNEAIQKRILNSQKSLLILLGLATLLGVLGGILGRLKQTRHNSDVEDDE